MSSERVWSLVMTDDSCRDCVDQGIICIATEEEIDMTVF